MIWLTSTNTNPFKAQAVFSSSHTALSWSGSQTSMVHDRFGMLPHTWHVEQFEGPTWQPVQQGQGQDAVKVLPLGLFLVICPLQDRTYSLLECSFLCMRQQCLFHFMQEATEKKTVCLKLMYTILQYKLTLIDVTFYFPFSLSILNLSINMHSRSLTLTFFFFFTNMDIMSQTWNKVKGQFC